MSEFVDFKHGMQCTKYVDVADLYRQDNVRGANVKRIPEMVASIRANGFKPNHPLVVSRKDDGMFLVLCGNRRCEALEWIVTNAPTELSRIIPGGKVPCIVHTGLTESEEILIRVDHSKDEDRVALDDYSLFLAVKQLVRAWPGDSETKIAEKLGIFITNGKNKGKPNRSFVQDRISLARLPLYVQEQFRLLWETGTVATAVRVTHIKQLVKTYRAEYAAFPDCDGPEFVALWDSIINPATVETVETDETKPADLTVKAALSRSQGCNSKLLRRFLLAVTGQGAFDPVELDAQVAQAEANTQILADIADYLGQDDFDDLVVKAREARQSVETVETVETVS